MPNSGFGGAPLPARNDDHTPRTPSALQRRETFARRHPEIDIRARRVNGQMRFFVRESNLDPPAEWVDANAMMDDLEARYS